MAFSVFLDPGQCDHFHLWEPGGSVPQAPHGAGLAADVSGHLQLYQVSDQAGI